MVHPVTAAEAPPAEPTNGPPPRTVLLIGGVILLAVVLAAVVATAFFRGGHLGRPAVAHVASGPVGGRSAATFDLVKGATSVTVRGADLGNRLYRVTASDDGDHAPVIADSGAVIQVTSLGNSTSVVVELNTQVTWLVRLTDGATSETLGLRDVPLSGVEFIGGASSIDLSLGTPHGTVPVRMSGGANRYAVHVVKGVPVQVRAGGGAGSVTIDGVAHNGVGGGTSFASDGWDGASDRYDVDNTAGVSTLTVDRA
jgi:hypothetical protein